MVTARNGWLEDNALGVGLLTEQAVFPAISPILFRNRDPIDCFAVRGEEKQGS
jgi:hypothetical protein